MIWVLLETPLAESCALLGAHYSGDSKNACVIQAVRIPLRLLRRTSSRRGPRLAVDAPAMESRINEHRRIQDWETQE